jgi:hypothetical protein
VQCSCHDIQNIAVLTSRDVYILQTIWPNFNIISHRPGGHNDTSQNVASLSPDETIALFVSEIYLILPSLPNPRAAPWPWDLLGLYFNEY